MATLELSPDRLELAAALAGAVAQAQQPRPSRVLHHPWRMVFPRFLNSVGQTTRAHARTFWGGRMNVVLPEHVSTVIWRYGFFESDVCTYLIHLLKRGMVFFDIGAHFGFFTLLGSHLTGDKGGVYSFEPTPSSFEWLRLNASRHPNISVFNVAASNHDMPVSFRDYGVRNAAFNSVYGMRKEGAERTEGNVIAVEGKKVDNLITEHGIKRLDVVKIDAESSEMLVLEGMVETIERFHPAIILEVGDFGIEGVPTSRSIVEWLGKYGYAPYELKGGKLQPHHPKQVYQYANVAFLAPSSGRM